jgi:hypothetical protein
MTMTSESPLILDAAPAAGRPALDGAGRVAVHHADRDEWIALAAGFEDHNYRQCFDYAAMLAARSNAVAENVVVTEDDEPIGLASVRVKRLPGTGTGIAYLSGGPLVRRRDGARLERVLEALRAEYVDRRRLVLRIAPAIGDEAWNAE